MSKEPLGKPYPARMVSSGKEEFFQYQLQLYGVEISKNRAGLQIKICRNGEEPFKVIKVPLYGGSFGGLVMMDTVDTAKMILEIVETFEVELTGSKHAQKTEAEK